MSRANSLWGPRIHGELLKLGIATNPGYRQEIETTNEFVRNKV